MLRTRLAILKTVLNEGRNQQQIPGLEHMRDIRHASRSPARHEDELEVRDEAGRDRECAGDLVCQSHDRAKLLNRKAKAPHGARCLTSRDWTA
jgi:hypothetical protein